jgi:hypothetical protein
MSKTTLRATIATISIFLAVTMGHWLLMLVLTTLCHIFGLPEAASHVAVFHTYGLTPTITHITFLVPFGDLTRDEFVPDKVQLASLLAGALGTVFYAGIAGILWHLLRTRFSTITGRKR